MDDKTTPLILAALARIEERQAAYEVVAHRMLDTLEVHTEKLDAILEAATMEAGPSPVAEALQALVAATEEQTKILTHLPEVLAVTIREEMQRELEAEGYETEPAEPGAFDRDDDDERQ